MRGEWKSTGDPTEVALEVFATKLGLGRSSLADYEKTDDSDAPADPEKNRVHFSHAVVPRRYALKVEFPFSSEVKRMAMIYLDNNEEMAVGVIKGAVRPFSSVLHVRSDVVKD